MRKYNLRIIFVIIYKRMSSLKKTILDYYRKCIFYHIISYAYGKWYSNIHVLFYVFLLQFHYNQICEILLNHNLTMVFNK